MTSSETVPFMFHGNESQRLPFFQDHFTWNRFHRISMEMNCRPRTAFLSRPLYLKPFRLCFYENNSLDQPAPVAQWLARRTVGRKVWGSNPIRVMWDFSALAGSYPELGVLWAQWEGWNHTAELHPLNGCVFEGVALITWPTLQVPQFPGLVNTGIIMTVSVVCGPVK